jgi:hypothetical protein
MKELKNTRNRYTESGIELVTGRKQVNLPPARLSSG